MQMNPLTKVEQRVPAEKGAAQWQNYITPVANILETPEEYVLEAEMPGANRGGLEITIENGELVITGHCQPFEVKGRELFRETRRMDYRRVFELDPSIDVEHISAQLDQGLLTLHLPKSESVKPRKIAVN